LDAPAARTAGVALVPGAEEGSEDDLLPAARTAGVALVPGAEEGSEDDLFAEGNDEDCAASDISA
jgi:hypothetical protein